MSAPTPALAAEAVQFLNGSPSPYHAVEQARQMFEKAGFVRINEHKSWNGELKRGGRYYYTRNMSTIVSFVVGGKYEAGNAFKIIGAHTDSPCPRVKPVSAVAKQGFLQVGVELYGGGLWHTWFDRDLSVAGKVIVREADGSFKQRLVEIREPILRVPNLAIHLQSPDEREAFKMNKQTHFLPILAQQLEGEAKKDAAATPAPGAGAELPLGKRHHPALLAALARQLGVDAGAIVDLDLSVFDVQPGTLGGLNGEGEASGSCRCARRRSTGGAAEAGGQALVEYAAGGAAASDDGVALVALFDHEEVGSESTHGASSPLIPEAMRRVALAFKSASTPDDALEVAARRSFIISADMAHGCHPNYAEKHEENHRVAINKGPVIKSNANQRYATNLVTGFIVRELCRRNAIPFQEFVVRNDSPCGSTIGPILAMRTGVRTVDIGNPQFAMHSVRETCGAEDVGHMVALMRAFLADFQRVDAALPSDA
eukprot:tig00021350_g20619.t1